MAMIATAATTRIITSPIEIVITPTATIKLNSPNSLISQ